MSADDGPQSGSPDLGDALVAALGFEPTAAGADDGVDLLVEEASAGAVAWSRRDGDGVGTPVSERGVQEPPPPADGAEVVSDGQIDVNSTAKVANPTMSPPKGKGKGPKSFKKSTPKKTKSGSKKAGGAPGAGVGKPAADRNGADPEDDTLDLGPEVDDADRRPGDENGVDPALVDEALIDDGLVDDGLVDVDSSGVKPVLVETETSRRAKRGLFDDPPPADPVAEPTEASPLEPVAEQPVATVAIDVDDTGPQPAVAEQPPLPRSASSSAAAGAAAVAETLISDAPPVSPPTEAPPSPSPSPGPPPPPASGDVGVAPTLAPDPNVTVPTTPPTLGAGVDVAARAATKAGDLAARMPQLLDQGVFTRTKRVRARKVRRVVRHVDPWSVLTFSVLFHLCVFAALLLSSVLVWNAAVAAGTIERVESFIRDLGDYETYQIKGDVVFRAAMVIAGILTLASSVLVVLLTVIFNLISDLVGGIRVTVIEEETVRVRRRKQ